MVTAQCSAYCYSHSIQCILNAISDSVYCATEPPVLSVTYQLVLLTFGQEKGEKTSDVKSRNHWP